MRWGRSEAAVCLPADQYPATIRLRDRRGRLVGSFVMTDAHGQGYDEAVEVAFRVPEQVVRLDVIPTGHEPYEIVSRLVYLDEAVRHLLILSVSVVAILCLARSAELIGNTVVDAVAVLVGVAWSALVKYRLDIRLGRTSPWP